MTDVCEDNIDSTLRKYTYMLYVGQLLVGVGATPLYTLGWSLVCCARNLCNFAAVLRHTIGAQDLNLATKVKLTI